MRQEYTLELSLVVQCVNFGHRVILYQPNVKVSNNNNNLKHRKNLDKTPKN